MTVFSLNLNIEPLPELKIKVTSVEHLKFDPEQHFIIKASIKNLSA